MKNRVFLTTMITVVAMALLAPSFAQVREKRVQANDYDGLAASAKTAFDAKKYISCSKELKKLQMLCHNMVSDELVAKRPAAPENFEAVPVKKSKNNNSFNANVAAFAGHSAQYQYQETDGKGNIRVTVTAESPLGQMMEAQFKFASMNPDVEVVKYGESKALFENKNGNLNLKILVNGLHYIEVVARGIAEEPFFKMFSQAFVDAVALILS